MRELVCFMGFKFVKSVYIYLTESLNELFFYY